MLTRSETFKAISKNNHVDLLIIGGGATGSGIALDAVSRGYRVLLVDKFDFSSGTSSKSTKLVHGGVRYLEQAVKKLDRGQFNLVYEALHERSTFLNLAPHLSRPLPIFTPLYRFWEKPYYRIGLKMYDWLAGTSNIGKSRSIGKAEAIKWFPSITQKSLKGGVMYYDGQFDDARMNITLLKTAAFRGALVLNYTPVGSLIQDQGKLVGATIHDELTQRVYTIHAKGIINATGPFVDSIRHMDDPKVSPMLTVSSGAHVIIKQKLCPENRGFLIPNTDDGRVLFLLPWNNATLAGTTDQPAQVEFSPKASSNDVDYILKYLSRYFDTTFTHADVLSSWSGLRPLVSNTDTPNTAKLSRDHVLITSRSGLLTITGGKWTTYRKMAEEATTLAAQLFKLPQTACLTKFIKLSGANGYNDKLDQTLVESYKIDTEVAKHLLSAYGANALDVVYNISPEGRQRLHPSHPFIEAEIEYAIKYEFAQRAADLLCRRTRLAFLDKNAAEMASKRVIQIMSKHLGWDESRQKWESDHWADIF